DAGGREADGERSRVHADRGAARRRQDAAGRSGGDRIRSRGWNRPHRGPRGHPRGPSPPGAQDVAGRGSQGAVAAADRFWAAQARPVESRRLARPWRGRDRSAAPGCWCGAAMIVAIDGGVASGKSAVGKRVAERLGLAFVDSGLMYRAITRLAAERGVDPGDADAVTKLAESVDLRVDGDRVWADRMELTEGIYDTDFADALPRVSAIPGVREALVAQQRRLGQNGVVMAGRDIGTVVFPNADYKFFLTASLEEKVRRRAAQYERRGEHVDPEVMRREVEERDRVDTQRAVAPLRPAPDAMVIDTDNLDVDQVVDR